MLVGGVAVAGELLLDRRCEKKTESESTQQLLSKYGRQSIAGRERLHAVLRITVLYEVRSRCLT
jgi:hypothetical protein